MLCSKIFLQKRYTDHHGTPFRELIALLNRMQAAIHFCGPDDFLGNDDDDGDDNDD